MSKIMIAGLIFILLASIGVGQKLSKVTKNEDTSVNICGMPVMTFYLLILRLCLLSIQILCLIALFK